jgi:hypothetical protein
VLKEESASDKHPAACLAPFRPTAQCSRQQLSAAKRGAPLCSVRRVSRPRVDNYLTAPAPPGPRPHAVLPPRRVHCLCSTLLISRLQRPCRLGWSFVTVAPCLQAVATPPPTNPLSLLPTLSLRDKDPPIKKNFGVCVCAVAWTLHCLRSCLASHRISPLRSLATRDTLHQRRDSISLDIHAGPCALSHRRHTIPSPLSPS